MKIIKKEKKNFKYIEITVMFYQNQYKANRIYTVSDIFYNDTISPSSSSIYKYMQTVYGDIWAALVFRSNGLNIATYTANAYISKITGIGRIGG